MRISLPDNEKCQEPGEPWRNPCGCIAALHHNSLSPIFPPCSVPGHGLFLLPIVCSRTAGPCILLQSAPSTGNYSVHKLVIQFFNRSMLPSTSHQSAPIWLGVCRFWLTRWHLLYQIIQELLTPARDPFPLRCCCSCSGWYRGYFSGHKREGATGRVFPQGSHVL